MNFTAESDMSKSHVRLGKFVQDARLSKRDSEAGAEVCVALAGRSRMRRPTRSGGTAADEALLRTHANHAGCMI